MQGRNLGIAFSCGKNRRWRKRSDPLRFKSHFFWEGDPSANIGEILRVMPCVTAPLTAVRPRDYSRYRLQPPYAGWECVPS